MSTKKETEGRNEPVNPLSKYRDSFLVVLLLIAGGLFFSRWQEQQENRETLPKEMIGGNEAILKLGANPKYQQLHKIGAFAEDSPNRLAFGKDAKCKALDLEINPPPDLDGISRKGLCDLRRKLISHYPDLLMKPYEPFMTQYMDVEDGLPWWGIAGLYVYGKGEHAMDGPSIAGHFLANPFLLCSPEISSVLFQGKLNKDPKEIVDEPFIPKLEKLHFDAANSRMYAEYAWSKLGLPKTQRCDIYLDSFNARDLGFKTMAVFESIDGNPRYMGQQSLVSYVHHSRMMGYPCNVGAPVTPEYALQPPCSVIVRLWKSAPQSASESPADFTCELKLK